ncbi:MAG: CBS domain-containing protein [Nitrospirae bacterium]|nr:CBS domain-containing protein [Nitrospirota bacterium]
MKVKELLETKGKEVFSMDSSATVEDAIRFMAGKKISAVIITEKDGTAGIFTERDVVRCYIAKGGRKFHDIPVSESMTRNLMVAELGDDLNSVMSVLVEKNIRHLPVVDKGKIIGMLSIRDIVLSQVHKMTTEIHYLKDYIAGY